MTIIKPNAGYKKGGKQSLMFSSCQAYKKRIEILSVVRQMRIKIYTGL
jgi:hypothetical protein